ncbi:diacylglycerol/lipid kinase family protein [Ferruginibacter yonginensis]|uniref:Diacylglycerol/lipid kinase family protein n=1 Tax=Ferruginibacter yonginensis TaxID=1310416 RepID=A0ABV8QT46_9BACT
MALQRRFLVFINPISGTQQKKGLKAYITNTLSLQQFYVEVLPTQQNGQYPFLKDKIAADNITDVIICGGDGTVNQISSFLIDSNVHVGIIPMGSGNGLAFAAGIPKNRTKALAIILKNNAQPIDAFYINNQFSCMLCGIGFDAQVAHNFAEQPSRGLATYAKETTKHFFSAKPYRFKITANQQTFTTQAFFISIANSNQFGNHVTIAPKASLSDGLLDIVVVNKTNKLNLIIKLLQQIKAGKLGHISEQNKTIQYFQTENIIIENLDNAPLHIDGEPSKTATSFNINIIKNAFTLIHA